MRALPSLTRWKIFSRRCGVTRRSRRRGGLFYRKSAAFLHFREDPAGLFAELRVDGAFEWFPVNTSRERRELRTHVAPLLA